MDVALMLISLLSSIISLIGLAWFRPLKQQQKVVKKTIYFFLSWDLVLLYCTFTFIAVSFKF